MKLRRVFLIAIAAVFVAGLTIRVAEAAHRGTQCFVHTHAATSEDWQNCVTTNQHDITQLAEAMGIMGVNSDSPPYYCCADVYVRYVSLWKNNVRVKITNFYTWYNTPQFSVSTDFYGDCNGPASYKSKFSYQLRWRDNSVSGVFDRFSTPVSLSTCT